MVDETLRTAATERGFNFGAAVAADPLTDDAEYGRLLQQEFNMVATENALKWGPLRPSRHEYDFEDAARIVDFAREHDLDVRGHTLIWHKMNPRWLTPWTVTDRQLREILREHIHTVAGRFRGDLAAWDVVNEAVADDGTMRETFWYQRLGEEYLDKAFQWAREADPEAKLFYNEYGAEGLGEKSDAVYDLLQRLLDRGVPVDGVGLQLHLLYGDEADRNPAPADIATNIERLSDLGLDVHITELDVSITDMDGDLDARLDRQAEYYREIVQTAINSACDTVVTWGVADCNSWLWKRTDGADHPLLFDENYRPKPAYEAVADVLSE